MQTRNGDFIRVRYGGTHMPSGKWITAVPGDQMAILPNPDSLPTEVLEIQEVCDVSPEHIHLANGQTFDTIGGASQDHRTFIVPATDQHRAALIAKRK